MGNDDVVVFGMIFPARSGKGFVNQNLSLNSMRKRIKFKFQLLYITTNDFFNIFTHFKHSTDVSSHTNWIE